MGNVGGVTLARLIGFHGGDRGRESGQQARSWGTSSSRGNKMAGVDVNVLECVRRYLQPIDQDGEYLPGQPGPPTCAREGGRGRSNRFVPPAAIQNLVRWVG